MFRSHVMSYYAWRLRYEVGLAYGSQDVFRDIGPDILLDRVASVITDPLIAEYLRDLDALANDTPSYAAIYAKYASGLTEAWLAPCGLSLTDQLTEG